jgi:leucyl aminopeptidase
MPRQQAASKGLVGGQAPEDRLVEDRLATNGQVVAAQGGASYRATEVPLKLAVSARVPQGTQVVGVGVYAGAKVAKGIGGVDVDRSYLEMRGFDGKLGETVALPGHDGQALVAVGLGPSADLGIDQIRRAAAALVRAVGPATSAALVLGTLPATVDVGRAAQAAAEGAALAAYRFTAFKGDPEKGRRKLATVTIVSSRWRELVEHVSRGERIARAVFLARDLVNEPAGSLTPSRLAAMATEVAASAGLGIEVLDEHEIEAQGLGGLAGVAAGSQEPARLIRLSYQVSSKAPTVALVGKGITFDSGGLSLKTPDGMTTMKTDMSGAAAVLATMSVLADLGVGVNVVGIMPTTENMPGGRAMKPGDVLRARNGKTIEVLNTDAEGRLVLADGLSLAAEEKPAAIIDLATLTGACVVALGRRIAGLMGNNDPLLRQVETAASAAGEPVWHLPLPDEYRKDIDSDLADIKNVGAAGQAGALAAGLFLKEFVGDVPWAHLDIAGPARSDSEDGVLPKGGTGFGVRTLIELVTSFTPPK